MKTMIVKKVWLAGMDCGWGNGYVIIPKGHPLHGVGYDDIDLDVHGGLTFSELVDEQMIKEWDCGHNLTEDDIGGWVVGFDTAHYRDTINNWPMSAVQDETNRLKEQLENYKVTEGNQSSETSHQ